MVRESRDPVEKLVGLEVYATDSDGIGGRIRVRYEDFVVEEVLLDGTVVHTSITSDKPLSKTPTIVRPGRWVWAVVEKVGIDTAKAALTLAKALGVKEDDVSWGGFKDTSAVTAQIMSFIGVSVDAVLKVRVPEKIKVRYAFFANKPITPSLIFGNRFRIVIRGVDLGKGEALARIDAVVKQLSELGGMPAFYGHQRFGTVRPNTHLVGKYIVKGMLEEAVLELVAHPYPNEPESVRRVREEIWESRDFSKGLGKFPKHYLEENLVINHLVKYPKDYVGALRRIPRQVLRLYVEAYQSYIFNRVLSERLRRGLPLKYPVPGDKVALTDEYGFPTRSVIKVSEANLERVRRLIDAGKAVLVLDVVGYNTQIPEGEPGEILRSVLEAEGVKPEDFRIRHMPELSSRGTYRPALAKVVDFSVIDVSEDDIIGGLKITLSFKLPRGNYATVLLREVMKPSSVLEAGF